MEPIGVQPRWRPSSLADRVLVAGLSLVHVFAFAPIRLARALLGRLRLDWLLLDLLSMPGVLLSVLVRLVGLRRWGMKANALAHTHLVCRSCPRDRQGLRDPSGRGVCPWNLRWSRGEFDIKPNFGPLNWVTQYGGKTDLRAYEDLAAEDTATAPPPTAATWRTWCLSLAANGLLVAAVAAVALPVPRSVLGVSLGSAEAWVCSDIGPTPGVDAGYPPQGLTSIDGQLVHSHHENDLRSRLFWVDDDFSVQRQLLLPAESVHASGLAWDGRSLWSVDYLANRLYRIDPKGDDGAGGVRVTGSWPTGLEGSSALTFIPSEEGGLIVVSDFLHTCRTWLVPIEAIPGSTGGLIDYAVGSYVNGCLSQGLVWTGSVLLESVGRVGEDRVLVIDVEPLLAGRGPARLLKRLRGPGPMAEDLATDGTWVWTTDEHTYRAYRCEGLADPGVGLLR